jgi:hypothetical protein
MLPAILSDLGRRLSLGQPTGLETIIWLYRKLRSQSRSRRGPTGRSWFLGERMVFVIGLSCFLFLTENEVGLAFIN